MDYSRPHSLPLVLQDYFWIPERVSLEGEDLVWDWGTPQLRYESGDVLGAFTLLAGGDVDRPSREAVLMFAKEYGPLYARRPPLGEEAAKPWREPIADWQRLAQRVQATAEVARRLGDGGLARDDLDRLPDPGPFEVRFFKQMIETDLVRISDRTLEGLSRPEFERIRKRQATPDGRPVRGTLEEDATRHIRVCVDSLMHSAGAQVQLEWTEDDRPRIALHGYGFLAVMAGQLVGAVYDGQLAVCRSCGAVITEGRKRPKGQNAFCGSECSDAYNRVRKRAERAR